MIEIGFNSRYLLDIANQIEGENVELSMADPGSPTILRDQEDTALYVLMPMRFDLKTVFTHLRALLAVSYGFDLGESEINVNTTRQVDGPLIRKLTVSNFRNYSVASLEPSKQMVVLLGNNGAGKTNLLEAISMLSPGRGLRQAQLTQSNKTKTDPQMSNTIEAQRQWAVSVKSSQMGFKQNWYWMRNNCC